MLEIFLLIIKIKLNQAIVESLLMWEKFFLPKKVVKCYGF